MFTRDREQVVRSVVLLAVLLTGAPAAAGQTLPSGPIALDNGRLAIGGEASLSVAGRDPAYFNYTDYDLNALRLIRLALAAEWRAGSRLSLLGDVRTENWDGVRAYALYARLRPWIGRSIDIQVGRIPPNFGAFARRGYGPDNLLIGFPLAYQYLTSLRPDALPASASDLAQMRGRGWRVTYPIGSVAPGHGVPLVSAFRWDTGAQVRIGTEPVELSLSVTNGTLANPRVRDDNAGKQISGRVAVRPSPGWIVGASAARGAFVAGSAVASLAASVRDGSFTQRALGLDVEYSRAYWLVRAEAVFTAWRLPAIAAPRLDRPLGAAAISVEGRYKLIPALYVAARAEHLAFSAIQISDGPGGRLPWDAPVTRLELGGGYSLARNLRAKLAYQHNWRDTRYYGSRGFAAAQLSYWF